MVIRKGGLVSDITVGDCLELTAALEEHHFRGSAGRPLFYALLKDTGVLPAGAPSRLRALRVEGRRSVAQIVDGYGIECGPVRDLLVEYFSERLPSWTTPRCAPSPATCAGCSGVTWRSIIPASTRSTCHRRSRRRGGNASPSSATPRGSPCGRGSTTAASWCSSGPSMRTSPGGRPTTRPGGRRG
jgi:hypothetical protein